MHYKIGSWVMIKLPRDTVCMFAYIEGAYLDQDYGILYEVLIPKKLNIGNWRQYLTEDQIIMEVL